MAARPGSRTQRLRNEAKRRGAAWPNENDVASWAAHRDATCAPRGGDARALSLQLRRVVRARPDYRETQCATSVRPIGGTSIKSRKPLIGVDVHARCLVESVRHVSSSRERRRLHPLLFFEARTRRPRSGERRLPRVRLYVFSFLSHFISRLFFTRCREIESVRSGTRRDVRRNAC